MQNEMISNIKKMHTEESNMKKYKMKECNLKRAQQEMSINKKTVNME